MGTVDPRRVELELLGERVELLPEGCVHWPRRRTLILADWRGAAGRREAGRLALAVHETGAERILVVGPLPAGLPPLPARLEEADGLAEERFVFRSRPAAYPDAFVWCGHLNPRSRGWPAFYIRPETGILPAFGPPDDDGLEVRPAPGEAVFAIESGCVTQALPPGRSA